MKLQMSVTFTPLSDPNSSEHQEKNNDDRQDNIERIHDRPHGFPYAKPLPIVSLGIRPKDAITVLAHIVEAYALHGFVLNQRDRCRIRHRRIEPMFTPASLTDCSSRC